MKNPPNPFMQDLDVDGVRHRYASLRAAAAQPALAGLATLPFSLRILAENLLRHAASPEVSADMLPALARGERGIEIPFWPARVLLQDMLGVPVMVDLAALRGELGVMKPAVCRRLKLILMPPSSVSWGPAAWGGAAGAAVT